MTSIRRTWSALLAAALVFAVAAPALAQLSDSEKKCEEQIAKGGGKFIKKTLKNIQKCNNKNLKEAGECPVAQPTTCAGGANAGASCTTDSECPGSACLTAPAAKLIVDIDKKCATLGPLNFASIGFPGKCADANPNDGFTNADLKACIQSSHAGIATSLIDIEYGTTTSITDSLVQKCQEAISKNGEKFVSARLKAVQKCRNDVNKGKLGGFAVKNCATANSKTTAAIAKADSKARAGIADKCLDPQVAALDACDPPATTSLGLQNCIIQTHGDAADNPALNAPADLIDFEYATPLSCGDGVYNNDVNPYDFTEECDGTDDDNCPGLCGSASTVCAGGANDGAACVDNSECPGGTCIAAFGCLCLDKPRERVVEHANADLDNGWTGTSHDSGIVEGGGYVVDLYDCDGPGGPDTLCQVGPSCTIGGAPCVNDAACGLNGPCRKERTAVGPHCNLNIQIPCTNNGQCPGTGNFCVKTYHGPPLPLSSGGVSVCVLNVFTEDVVGTKDLATGSSAVRLRQDSTTTGPGVIQQPCPVCGGFCGDPVGGVRNLCTSNADCGPGVARPTAVPCITEPICSFGANVDKQCRPGAPFGGPTQYFGTTSTDCGGNSTILGTIDILFNPVTTGSQTKTPSINCDALGFGPERCVGGPNEGKTCGADSDCTPGTCEEQCFCPTGGGISEKPNDCDPACVGGANDAQLCSSDLDCDPPNGFCHPADCRVNLLDDTNPNDGLCTSGPNEGTCSAHPFKTCNVNGDCQGANCTFCNLGETCVLAPKECFVNAGYTRVGVADPDDPTGVATFCETATTSAAVNNVAGLPGPAAILQPSTRAITGLP